ncbi:MAG: alpha/beta fold hydrolase [Leptolyngbyaceae cyanobacterium RM1_405_57]|nr:alpha/beta fold hydrolase [Leptolyngbyaceae cyanobacterium RM1_405_57]
MRLKQGFQIFALSVLSTIFTAIPTLAAQRISTFYGIIELSISIASLETYAQSGFIDNELAVYTQRLNPEDLVTLRQLLNQRIDFNSVALSQFLYSSMGESALEYVGELIQTDAHQNGFYAIRSTLILAAADPDGLTLLNVLKQFPSDTIRVNFTTAQQTIAAFTQLFEQIEQIDAWIEQQSLIAETASSITPSLDLHTSGSWRWRVETLTLYDAQRDRELMIDLYRPQFNQPAPVLILSPGLAASRTNFAYLAQHLASHGFAVAILDHPGSDRQQLQNLQDGAVSEVVQPSELIDRPLDISAVLDELERLNQVNEAEPFNLQQVGILGHSFGGYTALAVAGATVNLTQLRSTCESDTIDVTLANPSLLLQCAAVDLPTETIPALHDERLRAVFVFNPIGSSLFGADGLSQIEIPVMMVGGSQDAIAPALVEQICPFTWLTTPERYLALIQGGTHVYIAQREATALPILDSPDPLLARRYLKILSLAFAQTHVADRPEYQPYLTAAYGQAISQAPMRLRLVHSLAIAELPETIDFTCPGASPEPF